MPSTYIPRRDGDLDNWLGNFAALIGAAPAQYGLTDADATIIETAVDAWHAAYQVAIAPSTRTRPAVQAKDDQRIHVLRIVREYAAQIRANSAVSGELKVGLGLHVSSRASTTDSAPPVLPAPASAPVLSMGGLRIGAQMLRIRDSQSGTRRARPAGTAGALLYRVIADGPVMSRDDAAFVALVTRDRFQSEFSSDDCGKTATYFARWVNAKGEPGPWSTPASMRIAA